MILIGNGGVAAGRSSSKDMAGTLHSQV